MRPALVFPLHDTDGLLFSHLETATPALKEIFDRAFVSITPPTRRAQGTRVNGLQRDPFFRLVFNAPATLIGHHLPEVPPLDRFAQMFYNMVNLIGGDSTYT